QLGLGQVLVAGRAARLRERRQDAPRAMAGGAGDDPAHVERRCVLAPRALLQRAADADRAQASSSAASAHVRGLLQAGLGGARWRNNAMPQPMALQNAPACQLSALSADAVSARECAQRVVDIGPDELIMVIQMATVAHEMLMQSLRTFAEKVMPHFA